MDTSILWFVAGVLSYVCYTALSGYVVVMVVVCMTSRSGFVLLVYAGRLKSRNICGLFGDACMVYNSQLGCYLVMLMWAIMRCE